MRLIVGIDDCGHQFAVKADTFEEVKAWALSCLQGDFWKSVREKVEACHSENELLDQDSYLYDELIDAEVFWGRDTFTTLIDPLENKR